MLIVFPGWVTVIMYGIYYLPLGIQKLLFGWRINSNWLLYELLIFYVGLTDFFFFLTLLFGHLTCFHCDNLKDVKMFCWVMEGPYQSCLASLQVFHLSFFLSLLWLLLLCQVLSLWLFWTQFNIIGSTLEKVWRINSVCLRGKIEISADSSFFPFLGQQLQNNFLYLQGKKKTSATTFIRTSYHPFLL